MVGMRSPTLKGLCPLLVVCSTEVLSRTQNNYQIYAFRCNRTIAIVKVSREAKPHSTLGCALASHRPKQRTVDLFNTLCCWGCMYAVRLCSTMPPNMNFNVMSQTFSLQLYKNLNQVYKRKKHKHTYICARSMKTHASLLSIKIPGL